MHTFFINYKSAVWSDFFIGTNHGGLCLDGFDLKTVFHSSGGGVGLNLAVRSSRTVLGIRLVLPVAFGWLLPWRDVAALFLGDVGFWSVHCFNMLPERAGIRVAFGTPRDLTHIRFLQRDSTQFLLNLEEEEKDTVMACRGLGESPLQITEHDSL